MSNKKDVHIPRELLMLWNTLQEPWCIKNTDSCFIYANDALHKLFNLPAGYDMEGRYDRELPTPVAEFHELLVAQDKQVQSEIVRKASLEIHPYKDNKLDAYIVEKTPYLDQNGEVLGVICHARKLLKVPLLDGPASFLLNAPSDFFTAIEWDIIFLLQKRLPHKIIGKILTDISLNRIRKSIEIVYQKCSINNVDQLIEFLKGMHWDNYIPARFVKLGHTPLV